MTDPWRAGSRTPALLLLLFTLWATPAMTADAGDDAVTLLNALGCRGCHAIDGDGGKLGPPLDEVGSRLEEDAIRSKLLDPQGQAPDSMMPSFDHLSEENLELLVDYLSGLR